MRNKKRDEKRDVNIEMDSRVAEIFHQSTHTSGKFEFQFIYKQDGMIFANFVFVSEMKGRAAHMMKQSAKRRRLKSEIEAEKLAEQ